MGNVNIAGQKIKGNLQQMKGKVENAMGQHIKGNIDELRGKANIFEADLKRKSL